jgi:hypothetical protein
LASFNGYDTAFPTTPVVVDPTSLSNYLTSFFPAVDNTALSPLFPSPSVPVPIGSGAYLFIGGGIGNYFNAVGVAVSTNPDEPVSNLKVRYILTPNVHGTPTFTPYNPSDLAVITPKVCLPIPLNLPSAIDPLWITAVDVKGTKFINIPSTLVPGPPFVNHNTIPLYVYPFLIPNAWKFDPTSFQWYVDTTIAPWWSGYSNTINPDNQQHITQFTSSSAYSYKVNAQDIDVLTTATSNSFGFEDLERGVTNPNNENLDFNDVIFLIQVI